MAATSKSSPALRKFRQDIPLYILALPGVIALLLFSYFPMAGIVLVFKDYNFRGGIFGSPWADPITKTSVSSLIIFPLQCVPPASQSCITYSFL